MSYFTEKAIGCTSGELHFCTHSCVWDPNNCKLPAIRFLFHESFSFAAHKIKDLIKRNPLLESISSVAGIFDKTGLSLKSNFIESFPRSPYGAKEKMSDSKEHVFIFEENDARVITKTGNFLRMFAGEPYTEEKCKRSIDSAILDYYKFDKQILMNLFLKQRVKRIQITGEEQGLFLITKENKACYRPVTNAPGFKSFEFPLVSVKGILKMRYMFKYKAMEIFLYNRSSSLLLEFESEAVLDSISEFLKKHCHNLDPHFNDLHYTTQCWLCGKLSNFDYLLFLNRMASRTFHSLSQYPVFPWVITEFYSSTLDLDNPETYRDLSKPIAALNAKKLEKYTDKYKTVIKQGSFENTALYGSMYSTPTIVLYYLVRKSPSFLLKLQQTTFGPKDKYMIGLANSWSLTYSSFEEVKELIPEFYDPEGADFLLNIHEIQFGKKHTGEQIDNVELPPWAKSSRDCIEKMREALESDFVSNRINHWIDLIFGYKQSNSPGFMANNLFDSQAYEENINWEDYNKSPEKYESLALMLSQFGQIPKQLFKDPHPEKMAKLVLLKPIDSEETRSKEELASLLHSSRLEEKRLQDQIEKNNLEYDESLKRYYNNFKSFEDKSKLRSERLKTTYKEQKEKYRKAITEMQQKNSSLKEDFEELDKNKERHYLSIIESLRENYKRELSKVTGKTPSSSYTKDLERKLQRCQSEEKKQASSLEKLTDANRLLRTKNAELQRKLTACEDKLKAFSPSHTSQRQSIFK